MANITMNHRKAGAILALAISPVLYSATEGCKAFTVGNSAYRLQPLRNAASDARAVATALRQWGCDVEVNVDLTASDIEALVAKIAVLRADPLIIYFAGHGFVDKDGAQRIVGVNGMPNGDGHADTTTVGRITEFLDHAPRRVFVIIDACRAGDALSTRPEPRALLNSNLVLITSAGSGQIALDQPRKDLGLFVEHFIEALGREVDFITACHRTRLAVSRASNGRQVPSVTNEAHWRRLGGSPTAVALRATDVRASVLLWRGKTANEAVRECSQAGGRLPTIDELAALPDHGAVWVADMNERGQCGAWGGRWHPALHQLTGLRWFGCNNAQATIESVCIVRRSSTHVPATE